VRDGPSVRAGREEGLLDDDVVSEHGAVRGAEHCERGRDASRRWQRIEIEPDVVLRKPDELLVEPRHVLRVVLQVADEHDAAILRVHFLQDSSGAPDTP
jgi:hypothetical protein